MSGILFENIEESRYEFLFYDNLNVIRLSKSKNDDSEEPLRLPDSHGMIIKTTFVKNEESGRTFPNKSYFDYKPGLNLSEMEKKDKKSISLILKDYLKNYITKNNYISNEFELIEKSIVKKTSAVKYELKFSSFLSFNIVIEPSDFNCDNVSEFITGLPIEKIKEEKITTTEKGVVTKDPWKVELAKSSRAACRTCSQKIMKDTLRIGQPSYYEDHLSYKWHHLDCIRNFDENNNLDGLDELDQTEQELVKKKLLKPSKSSELDPKELITHLILEFQDSDGLTAESDIYKNAKERNLENSKIKEILLEMEEEGLMYRPDQGKIKLI